MSFQQLASSGHTSIEEASASIGVLFEGITIICATIFYPRCGKWM
jgi:hypothetical protein